MREVLTVIKGNYRKNKSAYIGIVALMLIVAMALTAVFSVLLNTGKRDKELIETAGFGHVIAAIQYNEYEKGYAEFCEELAKDIEVCQDVEKVERIPGLVMEITDLNGKSAGSSVFIFDDQSQYVSYPIYDENHNRMDSCALKQGEVSVPVCFQSLYNCNIGDAITLHYMGNTYTYEVASFLEDPYMGASMMGIKTLLLCEADINHIMKASEYTSPLYVLSVFREKDSTLDDTEFERILNKETSYAAYSWITLSRNQAYHYMTMLTNIFSSILIGFAIMLVVATIIVLNHNISNSIQYDYVNLGILKAIGMPNHSLKCSIMLGYLLAGFAGTVIGVPLAIPIIKIVNELTRPTTGLYVGSTPAIFVSGCTIGLILVILVVFIQLKLRKIANITPVSAIYGGRSDIHFSSLFKLPIFKNALGMSLAYRNLVTGKQQYISAVAVTAILVLFMTMISDMCLWFGNDGEKLNEMFSPVLYDVRVTAENDATLQEIDKIISEYTNTDQYEFYSRNVMMKDTQVWCGICSNPEQFHSVYEGRTCLYENEILITEYIADNYGLALGDSVEISLDEKSVEYIVSGIYQCPNDSGKNISMSVDGFQRFEKEINASSRVYKLENKEKVKEIVETIQENYEEEQAVAKDNTTMDDMESVIAAINGIAVIIYVVAAIFITVTVVLVCGKIFAKEKQDYGIYKSMGFTSTKLRRQFAIRFAIVALFGSVMGIVLTLAFSNEIIGSIFSTFGIANYALEMHLAAMVVPVVFMTVVYYLVAYLVSARMKKVTPRVLITE